ncbi:MAG TPA: lyase family protein, partial [Burkholderiales bacterium]|nr:lyase family protein [Burkholderiales bacterium]
MPSPLAALSPLDGRYSSGADPLRGYFSEQALIRYRTRLELDWLQALAAERSIGELKPFSRRTAASFASLIRNFSEGDAAEIKAIEAQTNHDVKAIELWLKRKLAKSAEAQLALEFIHFACTSEDVNNLAYALMIADSRANVMLPRLDELVAALRAAARRHAALPMLSRTHGQAATPTTLGKEMANFAHRLARARERIAAVRPLGKINGAVGNYNAHVAAYPGFDWERFCRRFVERLGLEFNPYTTQIEPHDWLAEL